MFLLIIALNVKNVKILDEIFKNLFGKKLVWLLLKYQLFNFQNGQM